MRRGQPPSLPIGWHRVRCRFHHPVRKVRIEGCTHFGGYRLVVSIQSFSDVSAAISRRWARLTAPKLKFDADLPIFIVTRDRVTALARLVTWLEDEGMTNVVILDNESTYPPLVEYLASTPHTVVHLGRNVGHTAPWDAGMVDGLPEGQPFIVTDPDVVPDEQAHGAVKRMVWLLNRHPSYAKVGMGLHIDDLPDHYDMKATVVEFESQYWTRPLPGGAYHAYVDTTFALYRPGTAYVLSPAMRTGAPYLARHDPWYPDSADLPAEFVYYREHASGSRTWGAADDDTDEFYRSLAGDADRPRGA